MKTKKWSINKNPNNDFNLQLPPGGRPDIWIQERHQEILSTGFRVEKVLYSEKSEFQKVDVVETTGYGRMLLNDGLVMVTERDECVYHEMIAHVPLFTHPNPKKVLIIGGGDGGTLRETLKHESVEKAYLVEIDPKVIEAAQKFLPTMSCAMNDPRAEVIVADGVDFVKNTAEKFDVVMIDSTDPFGPATPLFGEEFYQSVKKCLNTNGIVVSQGESPFYNADTQKKLKTTLNKVFPMVTIYNFNNLTYPGSMWSFFFSSLGANPIKDLRKQDVVQSKIDFNYYNAEIHTACFSLPTFLKKQLSL